MKKLKSKSKPWTLNYSSDMLSICQAQKKAYICVLRMSKRGYKDMPNMLSNHYAMWGAVKSMGWAWWARVESGMVGGSNIELNENGMGILLLVGSIYMHSKPLRVANSKDHISEIIKEENHVHSASEPELSTRHALSSLLLLMSITSVGSLLRAWISFMNSWASWTMASNLVFASPHANLAYPRVALPQVVSLKPVCHMDSFPVEWLRVRGRVTVLPLLARAIATVNVPVATRFRALSTYQQSEQQCKQNTQYVLRRRPSLTHPLQRLWVCRGDWEPSRNLR